MGFKEAVRTCLRDKYFTISGRAPRSEYWYFFLFTIIAWAVLFAIGYALGAESLIFGGDSAIFGIIIFAIIAIAIYIPTVTVLVRRFHDCNLSGWWVLGVMIGTNIPYIGILIGLASLVVTLRSGTVGENRFGPDPLREQNSADVFA